MHKYSDICYFNFSVLLFHLFLFLLSLHVIVMNKFVGYHHIWIVSNARLALCFHASYSMLLEVRSAWLYVSDLALMYLSSSGKYRFFIPFVFCRVNTKAIYNKVRWSTCIHLFRCQWYHANHFKGYACFQLYMLVNVWIWGKFALLVVWTIVFSI